jgi:osmoprotectant transport system ATP-binding protein
MISLRGIVKRFGAATAVDGADLEVAQGELCVLVGPSGCGKSTLLRTVNRMVEPDAGEVIVQGRDVRSIPAEVLRRGIGYVIQSVGLFPHLTVGENIGVVPRLLGTPPETAAIRARELLDLVGLDPRWIDRWPRELSGGEAQRVGVARALAADPPVLLMDEPFGSVDPMARVRLQREFLVIQRRLRKTVLFVTHDVEEAIRLADRIAVMRAGRILQHAPPSRFVAEAAGSFVSDFLGLEYGLELLGRHAVREALRDDGTDRADRHAAAVPPGAAADAAAGGLSIAEGATFKEALGLMVARRVDCLAVTGRDGARIGTIALGDVLGTMRRCTE